MFVFAFAAQWYFAIYREVSFRFNPNEVRVFEAPIPLRLYISPHAKSVSKINSTLADKKKVSHFLYFVQIFFTFF